MPEQPGARETSTTHHTAHNHQEVLPVFAETCLLNIANRIKHCGADDPHDLPDIATVARLDTQYNIAAIRARLGSAYPQLDFVQEAAAIMAFGNSYDKLPTMHPRFSHAHDHEHGHGHGHHTCGKMHGPIRRALETIEHKTLGHIRNRRAQLVAAMAFRASSLFICPGDDIAAIGLQTYSAFASHDHSHHQEHNHSDMPAILPRRPQLAKEPPVPANPGTMY